MACGGSVETIVDSDYFFKTLKLDYQAVRCNACFDRKLPLQRCRGCETVSYCSEGCREQDAGSGHTLECGSACLKYCSSISWAKEDQVPLFRLYARIKVYPHFRQRQHKMVDGSEMCYDDLPSKNPVVDESHFAQNYCADLVRRLKREDPSVTISEFVRLNRVYVSNVLPISDKGGHLVIGEGLFVLRTVWENFQKPTVTMQAGRFLIQSVLPTPLTGDIEQLHDHEPPPGVLPEDRLLSTTEMWCDQQALLQKTASLSPSCYGRISQLTSTLATQMEEFLAQGEQRKLNIWGFRLMFDELLSLLVQDSSCAYDERVTAQVAHYAAFAEHLDMDLVHVRWLREVALHDLEICFGPNSQLYRDLEPKLRALPFSEGIDWDSPEASWENFAKRNPWRPVP